MKALYLVAFFTLMANFAYPQTDDFEIVKNKIVAELLEDETNDQLVDEILLQLNPDGSFAGINYEDLSRTAGFPHRRHTSNLVYLARAYKSKTSKYYKKKSVLQKIELGLQYWVSHDYFGDNWHNNQISTPTNLVNLMLLVGNELPKRLVDGAQPIIGRAHMNASGARPSGDRIVIAGILAKNLLFTGNKNQFEEIIKLIEGEVKFSTGSRGMQHDYSFHHRHDRVNNTTSYGYTKYANAFGDWSYYVAKTKYAFSVEKINHLIDYYLDGIFPQQVYGIYPDISVKNRSITSKTTFEPLPVVEIERLMASTDYRKDELTNIIQLRKGETAPSKSFAKFFWQTEHFVFQRPGFYTTVRMFSVRNRNMEEPYNGPGKPTHHRADGTNYLQLNGNEYHNIWPVYDWQKISGTTIVQKPVLYPPEEIQKDGFTDFVGAVTDGLYGAVAFDFLSPHDFVKAKKSWFFFDEEYVCLGTQINSSKNLPVATTINQALLKSEVSILKNGIVEKLPNGNFQLEKVKWVFQDKVGYVFPEESIIQLSNTTQTGRWSDITDQKNISDELISEDVFLLWLNHGKSPQNESYQYIVVPNISEEKLMEKSKTNCNVEILLNTGEVQAVKHTKLGIVQCAFYLASEADLSNDTKISTGSQGMVMIKMPNEIITEITVSDPSRKLKQMVLNITGKFTVSSSNCLTFYNQTKNETMFIFDLPQGVYSGKSVTINI